MWHFEVLVEDSSGAAALEAFLPKILNQNSTFKIHSYRGIGRLPKNFGSSPDPSKRIFLDNLPRLLRGYGKAFANDSIDYVRVVVIVCDLDSRNKIEFESEIQGVIDACAPKPNVVLALSIEEGEAWLLSDPDAVIDAYPKAKRNELATYVPDSICGTWEKLADVVVAGGATSLRAAGYQEIGRHKHEWAQKIAPLVILQRNKSPSFQSFIQKIQSILQ